MQLRQVFALGVFFGLTSLAHATSLSFTFVTTGGDPEYAGSAATGTGALTVNAVPGGGSGVSAFTYTLTERAPGLSTVATTFSLGDITSFQSTVGGTATSPDLTSFDLLGQEGDGAFFNLNFNGPAQSVTDAYYAGSPGHPEVGSEGEVEYTPVTGTSAAITPEPSSFLLLGSGLLGARWVTRRRAPQ